MGKLVQLEVNNFKSYRGHHVLLFGDSYFTSIIGPNGSGKSNSMDAISFVLGIKSSHLRSTQLKDLIYRGRVIRTTKINEDGTATEATQDETNGDTQTSSQRHDPTTAWVMAVFEDDADQVHRWKRTITSAGQSEYRIDNRVVSQKAYNDALEEQSILIKARNFLVFQGDVESVASQNPKELTRLIEQISGSLEYKAEYERLREENEKAAESQTSQLVARRAINSEIKQYQEQKAEADEYERKVAERDDAIVNHVLWKLFHFQQTIQASSDEIAKHQEELKEHRRGVDEYYQRVEKARQAQAKVTRDVNKLEKDIKAKEKEIEDRENDLVPIDEKIKISNKDMATYNARLQAAKNERDEQTRLLERWQKDLATVQRAEEKWEAELRAASAQQGRDLSAQDIQEYNRLRGDVTKQTHTNQVEINRLEREVATDRQTVQNLKQKVDTYQDQVNQFEEDLKQLQQQKKDAQAKLKELESDRAAKQTAYNKMMSDRRQVEKQKEELNETLQENYQKRFEADSGRHQSRKEIAARETVAQMKRIFTTGVFGRYQDLIRPKQKKYDTAVSTLLGWHLDAIIVDTDRTAKECIQYLKEQKLGQFTFIPLDTIAIKPVNQNLKGMHPGMRLGIDCIDYDPAIERAMAAACGSSMICDSIQIAKHLCFDKRVDAKAVTLDGTVIAKGGPMTGGRSGSSKNTPWNDQAVENLTKIIDRLHEQLAALPRSNRRSAEEEALEVDLADLNDRIRLLQHEVVALDRNIASKSKELQHYKKQLRESQPNFNKARGRLENHEEELKSYRDLVDRVADQVFAAFCQRLGYGSIREYELQEGSFQQEAAEKRNEFSKQRSRLTSMEKFHQGLQDQAKDRIRELEARISTLEANIAEFEAEKEELQNAVDVLNAELETLQESLAALKNKQNDRASAVNDARKQLDQKNEVMKGVLKEVDGQEATIKRTAASRYALLRKCKMDEVDLPLVEGSASLNQLPIGDTARQDPDAMDVDEDPDATQLQQPDVDDYGIEVDFDQLEDDLKEDNSSACEARLQDVISALNSEIDKSNPNMRAGDRLNSTEAKLRDSTKVWDATRKSAQKAKKDFEDVKQRRQDLFKKAFNHISGNIKGTYKDLTKSTQYPLGGQAYLDMEDSDEPYMAGLKYHAMPPLKRFRDMEHLSGGEKTIAALALLFAIHSYQPSPFFVLDEVDAALDNVNVGRVAQYVREHAQPGMQFIVISLKAGFFQESESLVGVMRDQSKMSSRVVSLDLRKYQP